MLSESIGEFIRLLREYFLVFFGSKLVYASIVLMIISAIVSAAILLSGNENLKNALALSKDNPWGIVTANFVHGSFQHLLENIFSFTSLTFAIFLFSLVLYSSKKHIARSTSNNVRKLFKISYYVSLKTSFFYGLAFFLGLFIPGITSYVYCLLYNPLMQALGISSADYSLLGLLVTYSFCLGARIIAEDMVKKKYYPTIMYFTFLGTFLFYQFFIEPETLIGSWKEKINVVGHIAGLIIGFIVGLFNMFYAYVKLKKNRSLSHINSMRGENHGCGLCYHRT